MQAEEDEEGPECAELEETSITAKLEKAFYFLQH